MRKLRLRHIEQLAENYSSGEDQKLDLNSDNLSSESKLIIFIVYDITLLISLISPKHRNKVKSIT